MRFLSLCRCFDAGEALVNSHRSMFFGIAGHLEEGLGEVAVAFGILVEVVLMVVLGFIEIL